MNSVDRADQLRTNYNVGKGLRQRKWWWSIFLWGIDVAIVNAYLLYKAWHEMHGLKPMTHYYFREKIALASIHASHAKSCKGDTWIEANDTLLFQREDSICLVG